MEVSTNGPPQVIWDQTVNTNKKGLRPFPGRYVTLWVMNPRSGRRSRDEIKTSGARSITTFVSKSGGQSFNKEGVLQRDFGKEIYFRKSSSDVTFKSNGGLLQKIFSNNNKGNFSP